MGAKIVHFRFLGGPWHPEKNNPEKELKKEAPAHRCTSILETIFAQFFNDFSVVYLIRFLHHFWSHFGPVLEAKMEPKSINNRFKIRSKFQSDFLSVPGAFLIGFGSVLGTLDRRK